MRNLCAALAMSAFFALPLCAQQKSSGADGAAMNAAPNAKNGAASRKNAESSKPAAASGLFATMA